MSKSKKNIDNYLKLVKNYILNKTTNSITNSKISEELKIKLSEVNKCLHLLNLQGLVSQEYNRNTYSIYIDKYILKNFDEDLENRKLYIQILQKTNNNIFFALKKLNLNDKEKLSLIYAININAYNCKKELLQYMYLFNNDQMIDLYKIGKDCGYLYTGFFKYYNKNLNNKKIDKLRQNLVEYLFQKPFYDSRFLISENHLTKIELLQFCKIAIEKNNIEILKLLKSRINDNTLLKQINQRLIEHKLLNF